MVDRGEERNTVVGAAPCGDSTAGEPGPVLDEQMAVAAGDVVQVGGLVRELGERTGDGLHRASERVAVRSWVRPKVRGSWTTSVNPASASCRVITSGSGR